MADRKKEDRNNSFSELHMANYRFAMFHVERFRLILPLLAVVFLCSACSVQRSVITGNQRAYAYTWAQERQLGQQSDPQIVAQYGAYEDPELQAYVEEVAQRVLAQSHLRRPDTPAEFKNTPFTVRILDSPVVNAFALPGGYIYVTRGILSHLDNEAQLAVVLGHEIGHVAARHASQQAVTQQIGQLGVVGGAILGAAVLGGEAAESILNIGSQAAQLLTLRYGRGAERESDDLGVEYASLAGYEAAEGAKFFETLQRINEREGAELPTFLSTHPDPGARKETIQQIATQYDTQIPNQVVERERYLRAVEGTVFGENPRQGFVENGVFYHPDLRFRFPVPRGFQVVNQPQQVVLVASDQQALQYFQIVEASSAQAAATRFAQQQGLRVVDSGAARSGSLPAYFVLAEGQLQSGQKVGVLAYFVEHEGRVYRFTGLATTERFNQYDDVFSDVAQGFAPLTDARILGIKPWTIKIITASRTAPFRAFVPESLPEGVTPEDIAIINQVQLDTSIAAGTLLKIPSR